MAYIYVCPKSGIKLNMITFPHYTVALYHCLPEELLAGNSVRQQMSMEYTAATGVTRPAFYGPPLVQ